MTQFPDDLVVTPLEDGRRWRLVQDFPYQTDAGDWIVVAKGFVTDIASIPRALWAVLPPIGRYTRAAVIHDWLYHLHRDLGDNSRTREQADKILEEAMVDCGVDRVTRYVIFDGVRAGAEFAWKGEHHETTGTLPPAVDPPDTH